MSKMCIRDRVDADGVHVGQSDMEAGKVREKLGPDKIIGVSCKNVEQALLAKKHGADYLGVGAIDVYKRQRVNSLHRSFIATHSSRVMIPRRVVWQPAAIFLI